MVKAIYFIKRKPGMELAAFRSYWLNQHAAVVRRVPELRKYVQSHTLDSGYRRGDPLYDGVAELWYEDTATMRRIADTPESRAAAEDDHKFLDMSDFDFILTEEIVQKDGPTRSDGPKLVVFLNRRPDITPEKFQEHWRGIHGRLGAAVPAVRRYVQCHVRLSAYRAGRAPRYDGVAETWFDSIDDMRASEKAPEYRAVRADEPNFLKLDGGRLPFIITREYAIV